jgi:malonyl CoA-acyl carrier protein transacylase
MALDFLREHKEARAVFEDASRVLGYDVAEICAGPQERLDLTEYAQPCILTVEIAMYEVIRAKYGIAPRYFGGHSLGEYTALVAAGAMPFEVALPLVRLRGQLMQKEVASGAGRMIAIIREQGAREASRPALELALVREAAEREGCELANVNSEHQVVLSGMADAVERAAAPFRAWEAEERARVITLATSAPFHSRWMRKMEPAFAEALRAQRDRLVPERARAVLSNYSGEFHLGTADALVDGLVRQISGTVRWNENMTVLAGVARRILEVGPDRPLRGFFYSRGINISAVTDVRTMGRAFPEFTES